MTMIIFLILLAPVISAIFFSATLCDLLEFTRKEREASRLAEQALENQKTAIIPNTNPCWWSAVDGSATWPGWLATCISTRENKSTCSVRSTHEADE